jgi:hypothetical protein
LFKILHNAINDFILDFFLSDFCLLGFNPLPVGVFDFSTLAFSSFVNEFSTDDSYGNPQSAASMTPLEYSEEPVSADQYMSNENRVMSISPS